LAECISNDTDIWRELKKINPRSRNMPTTVDEGRGRAEIAKLFVSKYETLYRSVPTTAATELS